jgi:3'(2'), 5'-bisphosphate nucleotidase
VDLESLWTTLDERLLPVLQSYRERLPTLDVSVKADKTLLSEADLAAQKLIVEAILESFPGSGFVAEEDDQPMPRQGTPMWVIDPIDGTSQFVDPLGREYCSVVCRLDEGTPTGAYVLAPELGTDGSPIIIHWSDGHVTVNGRPAVSLPQRSTPRRASVTRSKNSAPRPYESELASVGSEMKLRTTSQTVDMIRTCLDLSEWTGTSDPQFDLFYRRDQKLWDGAAGIGLAGVMGRLARTGTDEALFPVTTAFLAQREPVFVETVAGDPECVRWFLELLRTAAAGGE